MSAEQSQSVEDINTQVNSLRVRSETHLGTNLSKRQISSSDETDLIEPKKGKQTGQEFSANRPSEAIARTQEPKAGSSNQQGQKTKQVPPHLEKAFKTFRGLSEKTARYCAHVEFLR
jgi:hypothetical protein